MVDDRRNSGAPDTDPDVVGLDIEIQDQIEAHSDLVCRLVSRYCDAEKLHPAATLSILTTVLAVVMVGSLKKSASFAQAIESLQRDVEVKARLAQGFSVLNDGPMAGNA